jgi:hypothetical protein
MRRQGLGAALALAAPLAAHSQLSFEDSMQPLTKGIAVALVLPLFFLCFLFSLGLGTCVRRARRRLGAPLTRSASAAAGGSVSRSGFT